MDELKKDIVIDVSALRDILQKTNELRKLSIKNANEMHPESLEELINMIIDLILSSPPRLTELDFCGVGGSSEQGS